ncbi:MAG: hypothetical protein WB817_07685 [Terriglobales bacterium]
MFALGLLDLGEAILARASLARMMPLLFCGPSFRILLDAAARRSLLLKFGRSETCPADN